VALLLLTRVPWTRAGLLHGCVGCVSRALFLLLLVSCLALNRFMREKGCWCVPELCSRAEEDLAPGYNMEIVITDLLTDFILGL